MGNYYIIMIVHLSIYICASLDLHSWALIHRHFPRFIKLGFHSSIRVEREITVPNTRTTWRNNSCNAPFSGRHHSTKNDSCGGSYMERDWNITIRYGRHTHTTDRNIYIYGVMFNKHIERKEGGGETEARSGDDPTGAVELLRSMNYSIERRKKKI